MIAGVMREISPKLPFFVHRLVRNTGKVLRAAGIKDEPVLVAVSGGSDSMALLEIAGLLAPELGLQLHVACVDHGIRPEAAAEMDLVREAAARWEAQFHGGHAKPERDDEDTLRRARYALLRAYAEEVGARFILLGHTSDDQIETVLLRFLRGAGLGGLAGMREVRAPLVRPLLAVRRDELRRLLQVRGVAWAEDATNLSDRYARGRLRAGVLPAIVAAFGRGALDHLLDVAPLWRRDEDYLEQEAARAFAYVSRRGKDGVELDAAALATIHAALRSRVLRRWLRDCTANTPGTREIAAIERWLDRAATGGSSRGSLDLPGASLLARGGRLVLRATSAGESESCVAAFQRPC